MKIMNATTSVLNSTTRPCDEPNRLPPSSSTIETTPVAMVTTIATVEIRPNPRTAWTRSSSPGPASTTRASRTTPPSQTDMASVWRTAIVTPTSARSMSTRLRPMVATATPGMMSATIWVTGSITRSGRNATQALAATNTSRANAAIPGIPALSRSTQFSGLSPLPQRRAADGCRGRCDVQHGAEHRDDRCRPDEANREQVLDAFGPRGSDEHERTEQHREAEYRQQPPEPERPLPGVDRLQIDDVARRRRGRGPGHVDGAGNGRVGGGVRGRRDGGRVVLHREGQVAGAVRRPVGIADTPTDHAVALREWIDQIGGQGETVVADPTGPDREQLRVALDGDRVDLAEFLGEGDVDGGRRRGDRGAIGRGRARDGVLGVRSSFGEQGHAEQRERDDQVRTDASASGNRCALVHDRHEASGHTVRVA